MEIQYKLDLYYGTDHENGIIVIKLRLLSQNVQHFVLSALLFKHIFSSFSLPEFGLFM